MTRQSDHDGRTVSRRRLLKTGAGLGATALLPGALAGRASARIAIPALIPRPQSFEGDLTGFFLHVRSISDAEPDSGVVSGCAFSEWSPEKTASFDATLVDRVQEDHPAVETLAFTAEDRVLEPGSLYVVNRTTECPQGYVGIELEFVSKVGSLETDTDASTGTGSGFGPLAALGGAAAGVYGLLRRKT